MLLRFECHYKCTCNPLKLTSFSEENQLFKIIVELLHCSWHVFEVLQVTCYWTLPDLFIFFSAQCASVQVLWCVKRCSFIHSFSKPLLLVKVSWIPSYFKTDSTSAYFHFVQWRDLCILECAVRTVEKSFCKQSCDKECLKPKITPQPPPFPTLSFPVTF